MPELGHPVGLPQLFLDRSLGRRQVPGLLREHGLQLRTLAEVYGIPADQAVTDVTWLETAGRRSWAVLMKDERIRYRPAEKAALLQHRVRAFCLANGNLRARDMADLFLGAVDEMVELCARPEPLLGVITARGVRPIDLT